MNKFGWFLAIWIYFFCVIVFTINIIFSVIKDDGIGVVVNVFMLSLFISIVVYLNTTE